MKIILLFIAVFPSFVYSQSLVFTPDSEYSSSESASHGILSSGQKISIFQSYDYFNSFYVSTVVKIDSNGPVLNQFSFAQGSSEYIGLVGITPMDNDEYIIGFENFAGNFYLICFASDNTVLWKKNYAIPDYFGAYYQHQIIKNGSGGIYLMISNYENLMLLKINSLGNLEWSKAYIGPESGGKSPGFSICVTPDNGVIATLKDGSSQCFFRVNEFGTVQWSKSFNDMSYRWPISIRETNNGNYIIAGILNGYIPYLHKITSSGEFLFAKIFEQNYSEVFDVKQHSNGNFFILGYDGINSGIIEVDQDGNHVLTKFIEGITPNFYSYPKFANKEFDLSFYFNVVGDEFHARIDFDGDMNAICNSYQPEQYSSMNDDLITQAIINTGMNVNNVAVSVTENVTLAMFSGYDLTAEDFCGYILGLEETDQEDILEIYPNPANDYININTNGGVITQIELFDLHGKCVQHQTVELTETKQIDVSNLPSGIYRIVMLIDGNLVNEQVVIGK